MDEPRSMGAPSSSERRGDGGAGADWGGSLIGDSPAMRTVRESIEKLAPWDMPVPVLIEGESGTGKGLVARAIHQSSLRRRGAFVPYNSASLEPTLADSVLFGHEAGAYTDARTTRAGLFEAADGGTLFLDEIANLPKKTQAKLLKALEDGEVMRLGATKPTRVDVRVISATNRDLELEVEEGRFLADLVPRLNTEIVWLPPLRERVGDIRALAEHYAAKFARQKVSLAPEAIALLEAQSWPENVRGLVNIVERAVIEAGPGRPVAVEHVREALAKGRRKAATAMGSAAACSGQRADEPDWEQVAGRKCGECRRRSLEMGLRVCGGDISELGRRTGVSRTTLNDRLVKAQIEVDAVRAEARRMARRGI